MTGAEQVLIEDWCQQYPSHSIGALAFGPDGALYASGGDGASFNFADYGQDGNPAEPLRRSARRRRRALTPPTAEGGALRSQDLRTSGDPVTLDGTSSASTRPRVRPARQSHGPGIDPNARRIIAYGLRNPFRFTLRPGTSEIWIGDVGWSNWEEINRIVDPDRRRSSTTSAGPATKGTRRQSGYDGANLNICENLYAQSGSATRAVLRVPPQQQGRPGRDVPDGRLIDRRARVRVLQRRALSERVPRRTVLRGLLPRLHLGDEEGRERHSRARL